MPFSDIVAVSGLLLTLTTFLFNLAWPKLTEAMAQDEYQSGLQARKRSREKVIGTLLGCALPLTCAFAALFYVNLPAAVRIIQSSRLALWDFDVDHTLYVMVVMTLLAFTLINARLTLKLLGTWRNLH